MDNQTRFSFSFVQGDIDMQMSVAGDIEANTVVQQFAQFLSAAGYDHEVILEGMETYLDPYTPDVDGDDTKYELTELGKMNTDGWIKASEASKLEAEAEAALTRLDDDVRQQCMNSTVDQNWSL